MPSYTFKRAQNSLDIKEQLYATARAIKFSTFDSCLGVIARKGGLLTGVHLVMYGTDLTLSPDQQLAFSKRGGATFDNITVPKVLNLLPARLLDEAVLCGFTELWAKTLPQCYKQLTQALKNALRPPELVQEWPILANHNTCKFGAYLAKAPGRMQRQYEPM